MILTEKQRIRFWLKVAKTDGCWVWVGHCCRRTKYGTFRVGKAIHKAHRVAWELMVGPIATGKSVLHRCDHRACVNPDHLFLGTRQDNMDDMKAKGRQSRLAGELNPRAKLTIDDVREVRRLHAGGHLSRLAIAKRFHVDWSQVNRIVRNEQWRESA